MERLAEESSLVNMSLTSGATERDTHSSGTQSETEAGNQNVENNTSSTPNGSLNDTSHNTSDNAKRMLYRHPQDRLIGGVCGGLSELTGVDANLIRILWVIATLATGGGGILAYLALWMLLPVGTVAEGQMRPAAFALNGLNMGRTATVLIAIGALWFLANVGALPWLWGGFWRIMSIVFWPALLIGAGYLLLRYSGRGEVKWNWSWSGTRERMQNGVSDRMPTKQSLKESYNSFRQRFPVKRSRTDRIFMGVCGGIGQRIGIDANLVRLVWAAFSVGSIGMGVLIYVLLGLFLVQESVTDLQPYDDEVQEVQVIDARTSQV